MCIYIYMYIQGMYKHVKYVYIYIYICNPTVLEKVSPFWAGVLSL